MHSQLIHSTRLITHEERESTMDKKPSNERASHNPSAQPRLHQRTRELQAYGTVLHALPLDLEEPVRLEMTEQLNQCLPIP